MSDDHTRRDGRLMSDDLQTDARGQAYTLEGIIAAIVVVSALVIGLQAVDPAPWTESDPVDTDELGMQAQDLLAAADDRDVLRPAVSCVDAGADGELESGAFEAGESTFGNMTERMLGTGSYRVAVEYHDGTSVQRETVVNTGGRVGRTSTTETRQVALFENDPRFTESDGECQPAEPSVTLGDLDDDEFYADNIDEEQELFAIVTVRVVAW